ncbi:MAG: hypothetical protein LC808_17390 [Actinobacteria bacterium]|nr:hypothetical protein [Actinomycetota bacterium]
MRLRRRGPASRGGLLGRLGEIAAAVGRGLFAGAAGTAAMTVSSTLEMKLRGREGSSAPADATGKILDVQPRDETANARFANMVHWGYGTSWGAARGLIAIAGLSGPAAMAAHFAAIWPSAMVMLPSLGVAPPPWKWGATELGIDALHHAVYVSATGVAFAALDRR